MRLGRSRPDLPLGPGERLLAWAETADGTVIGGTRDAFYAPARIPWEQVQAAGWDRDTATLRISEVGEWGAVRPEHVLHVAEADRLMQLVRERVTASVVHQRHVPLVGTRGIRVIARRPPGRPAEITWIYEYDEGIDPDDPLVRLAAAEALAGARGEVGLD